MMQRQRKRQSDNNGRELTQQAPTLSAARISAVRRVLETLPTTQEGAVAQMWQSVARWPSRLRLHAFRIIANKLAADVALRGLLLINRITDNKRQATSDDDTLHLDPNDPDDQQTLDELLALWAHLPAHVQVQGDRDFERFARITVGLQQLINAAPPQATDSWAFDSGPQYCQMLSQANLLPVAALTAQAFISLDGKHTFQIQINHFDDTAPMMERSDLPWRLPAPQRIRITPSNMIVEAEAPA